MEDRMPWQPWNLVINPATKEPIRPCLQSKLQDPRNRRVVEQADKCIYYMLSGVKP